MYTASVVIDSDVFKAVRGVSAQAPKRAQVFVNTLQRDALVMVKTKIAPYPGPSVHPFEFATERSKRWYFANLAEGKIPTDGKRYKRQHNLENAWEVKMDRRGLNTFMTINNSAPYAVFVYGPGVLITTRRQVPGHRRTGWGGKKLDDAVIAVSEFVQDRLIDWWFTTGTELNII